jgi:acyl dehydratase
MKITKKDHYKFIKASLDDNQVHTNINVATNLGANSRIIHGIHQVIYILNTLEISELEISSLNFNFIKPLSV